jgi:hypothetical protein
MASIWSAAAATPTATHRLPADVSAGGAPTMYTVQQLADLATSIGLTHNAIGNIGTNTTIDLSSGGYVSATITGNLTFTFSNPAASPNGCRFVLVLTNGGAHTITWPGSVTWAGATAPTLSASGVDVLQFVTGNGGTNWYGWVERDETAAAGLLSATTTVNVSSATAPSSGQVLTATSSTAATWQTPSGGSPAGSGTEVQYRVDGTTFGAMAGTAWDNTTRSLTMTGATVTASAPVLDLSQTWNNAAVPFTGLKFNVTNTASAAASLVVDVQVGGVSILKADKTGVITAGAAVIRAPYGYLNNLAGGMLFTSGYTQLTGLDGSAGLAIATAGGNVLFPTSLSFGANYYTPDVYLRRDAANTLAQRNGTNAQTSRIYGTYTDASNYVRAALAATSTAVTLTAETAGTGADDIPVRITPAGVSQVEVGNGVQFTEMTAPSAPAANKVILFAQDNGAGKTQLMALFASGAAQQVAIEP